MEIRGKILVQRMGYTILIQVRSTEYRIARSACSLQMILYGVCSFKYQGRGPHAIRLSATCLQPLRPIMLTGGSSQGVDRP